MNSYDLVNQFDQDWKTLNEAWQRAYTIGYSNADTHLRMSLTQCASRNLNFRSAPSNIAHVKQALGELRRIEEQMTARLDQLDGDIADSTR